MQRVNIHLPAKLWREAKAKAALLDIPARELVERAVREYLERIDKDDKR